MRVARNRGRRPSSGGRCDMCGRRFMVRITPMVMPCTKVAERPPGGREGAARAASLLFRAMARNRGRRPSSGGRCDICGLRFMVRPTPMVMPCTNGGMRPPGGREGAARGASPLIPGRGAQLRAAPYLGWALRRLWSAVYGADNPNVDALHQGCGAPSRGEGGRCPGSFAAIPGEKGRVTAPSDARHTQIVAALAFQFVGVALEAIGL